MTNLEREKIRTKLLELIRKIDQTYMVSESGFDNSEYIQPKPKPYGKG